MNLIIEREKAERLARAIGSDLVLYNEKKIRQATSMAQLVELLTDALNEGRKLFRNRVDENLLGTFDSTIQQMLVQAFARVHPGGATPAVSNQPVKKPTNQPGAERLARAISSDVVLYNSDKIAQQPSMDAVWKTLSKEVEEAKKLFLSRMGADLLDVFEAELRRQVGEAWLKGQ
jgi:hypothetical protein